MSVLSSYDRRKFYHALPVFKSPLLRPGISISSHGRRAPIKETKWISTRDAAAGVIRGGTPASTHEERRTRKPKGGKGEGNVIAAVGSRRASWCSKQDAHLSRGR